MSIFGTVVNTIWSFIGESSKDIKQQYTCASEEEMIYWNHNTECVETMSDNRMVNNEMLKWMNEASYENKRIDWESITQVVCKTRWYILFIYSEGCRIDPLYKWMMGTRLVYPNMNGIAYCFKSLAARNAMQTILDHMLHVSSVSLRTPVVSFQIHEVIESSKVYCRCGGHYYLVSAKSHFCTKRHQNWMDTIKEMLEII